MALETELVTKVVGDYTFVERWSHGFLKQRKSMRDVTGKREMFTAWCMGCSLCAILKGNIIEEMLYKKGKIDKSMKTRMFMFGDLESPIYSHQYNNLIVSCTPIHITFGNWFI